MTDDELTEKVARAMHTAYEAAAADSGWETQEASRVPWDKVPEANKAAMLASARAAIAAVREAEGPTLYTQADLDAAVRAAYEEGWYDGAKVPIGERGDQELGWACLMDYEKSAAAIRERGSDGQT